MKKYLTLALLTALSTVASADWMLYENETHGPRQKNTYLEWPPQVQGRIIKFWILQDFQNYMVDSNNSLENQYEINCDSMIAREIRAVLYKKQMGKGAGTEMPPAPGSFLIQSDSVMAVFAAKGCPK